MSHEQNEMNGLKARTKKESKEKEEVELFALDFSMADTIRVIEAPVNVITEIRHAICMHWRQGIQRECVNSGAYEFKLKGYPFRSTKSKDIIDTLMMLIQILENVRLHAFKVCASMDMNVVSEEDESIDTWMFRRTGHNRQRNELDGWVVEL
ncbi:hypothetical protein FBU30_006366 [Linnemannia zychae]|nr:hypothetical protein FBU30_006366 [Linnemannia zychae]